ncbi:hypothetical protein A5736_23105 [Mycobacterium sp. SP-6446]|nr:hypothetical protein A5736_23105 [Mycobacterium sp. SP-6446]
MTARLNDTEWLRRQLGPDGHSDGDTSGDAEPIIGLGGSVDPTRNGTEPDQVRVRPTRLDRRYWFGGLAAVGIVIVLLGVMLLWGDGKPAGQRGGDPGAQPATVSTVAAPTPVAAETTGADRPLPFTASANCPAGSTSAQTLAGADPTNAFVCVRDLVDGQVIRLDLSKTYVITAISITPGWVGKDSSGASQWAQHRVVTRVQYVFDDTDRTMVMQDTGNVHGEAVQPVKHVLASKVTILILQTSRPPAETTSVPTPGLGAPGGGLFGEPNATPDSPPSTPPLSPAPMMSPGGQPTTDPVDSTFAISRLKIIGHEAV